MERRRLRLAAVALIVIAVLPLIGFGYAQLRVWRWRAQHRPPGRFVDVDGSAVHLHCLGSGAPVIILECGQGDDWTEWQPVQAQLAKVTCTCAYDRAGLGWSEPRPGVRDSNAIAEELHRLLDAAAVPRPIILVARSAGGLHARVFAARYPRDVAALALLDASTPEQVTRFPPRVRKAWDDNIRQARRARWLATFGWCKPVEDCIPSVLDAEYREAASFYASAAETLHAGPFGDLPLVVVSQDPAHRYAGTPEREQAENSMIWNSLQDGLLRLSTRSRRTIARGSGHAVQRFRPDVVIAEVTRLVEATRAARRTAPPAAPAGNSR